MFRQSLLFALVVTASPVLADDTERFALGGDAYFAGRSVDVGDAVAADLFAVGNKVSVEAEVAGSAHLVARSIEIDDAVSGNVYAAGMDVEIDGPVSGSVSAMGDTVVISEAISGNLRAMGAEVDISGPIAGSAIVAGDMVLIDGEILGDLAVSATEIDWGEDAKVSGTLHLYSDDPDEFDVPDYVASEDRITRHEMADWEATHGEDFREMRRPGFWAGVGTFFGGVVITGIIATLMAALAPGFTQTLREGALLSPLRSLWMGALALSAVIGSTLVLAMTGIGIFLAPLSIALAFAVGFAGYVIGAYLLGVWAVDAVGQGLPESTADRAIAAFVGAAILGVVALIPFIGWLAVLAVALIGIGGLAIRLFAPAFYADAA